MSFVLVCHISPWELTHSPSCGASRGTLPHLVMTVFVWRWENTGEDASLKLLTALRSRDLLSSSYRAGEGRFIGSTKLGKNTELISIRPGVQAV